MAKLRRFAPTLEVHEQLTRAVFTTTLGGLPAGTPNPVWDEMLEMKVRGYDVVRYQGNKAYIQSSNGDDFSFVRSGWVTKVCGVETDQYQQELLNWSSFVEATDAQLGQQVPAFMTNPFVLDEDGTPTATRKTWVEWANGVIAVAADQNLIELNGGGRQEPGSIVARLINAGATVYSLQQARELIPPATL